MPTVGAGVPLGVVHFAASSIKGFYYNTIIIKFNILSNKQLQLALSYSANANFFVIHLDILKWMQRKRLCPSKSWLLAVFVIGGFRFMKWLVSPESL